MRGYLQHLVVQRSQTAHTRLPLTKQQPAQQAAITLTCCQTSTAGCQSRSPVVRPVRLCHGEPLPVCLESELQHPLRLPLLGRDSPHHVFIEPLWEGIALDDRLPAGLVRPAANAELQRKEEGKPDVLLRALLKDNGAPGCTQHSLLPTPDHRAAAGSRRAMRAATSSPINIAGHTRNTSNCSLRPEPELPRGPTCSGAAAASAAPPARRPARRAPPGC